MLVNIVATLMYDNNIGRGTMATLLFVSFQFVEGTSMRHRSPFEQSFVTFTFSLFTLPFALKRGFPYDRSQLQYNRDKATTIKNKLQCKV